MSTVEVEQTEWFKRNRRLDEAEAAFNQFIKAWVAPAMQGHLLDNDNNAGERVRQAIRALHREDARLENVVALVDAWMCGYGPGTRAENVMGKQVVSVEFLHQQVHAIADDPT